ncbi:MAG: hypothetical protein J1E99_06990 [Muribaculaceae bacterium]|nr:hypothetical protein [Muribaculaceae bacterium]
MKKHSLWLVAIALGLSSCVEDAITSETPEQNQSEQNQSQTSAPVVTLSHSRLTSYNSSQSRVSVTPQSREAQTSSLSLYAEISNLSKDGSISGFVKEEGGRYLSATCVYYEQATGKYYVTYHMQGNNYNTQQTNETGGYIETFTLDQDGKPTLRNIYSAANPEELSFDFNHLYFDNIPSLGYYDYFGTYYDFEGTYDVDGFQGTRLIAVGHKSEPSKKEGGEPNTAAIIAKLNLDGATPTIDYATVYTGDKLTDDDVVKDDGSLMSLGDEDAKDVNCVVRKYNNYYLATRKGVAVLKASEAEMFSPQVDEKGHYYFMRTPGSAKFLSQPMTTSYVNVLYLQNDTPDEGLTAETSSLASLTQLALDYSNNYCPINIRDLSDFSWSSLSSPNTNLISNIDRIKPVDGKNVVINTRNITAIALGKGGLYVNYPTYLDGEIKTFSDKKDGSGSRPVNGLFVEEVETFNGRTSNNGFIYVANGSCLTIVNSQTLDTIAEYSAFEEGDASANYVYVQQLDTKSNGQTNDRLITVAFGQAGVKVFKFIPPTNF